MRNAPDIVEITTTRAPFDTAGIARDADGVSHYRRLPESLVAMLRARVDEHPAREALVESGGARLGYAQLWERAARVAGGLRAAGLTDGDRVAIRLPAGVDWVVGFFGALLAGGVVVAINTRLAEPEVADILDDSASRFTLSPDRALPDGAPFAADHLRPDDLAALFYTSGTTGRPKGARMTHRNFMSNVENAVRAMALARGDDDVRDAGADFRTLVSVPLFHVTGCNTQLLTTLYLGGATVILPALDIATLLKLIAAERISWLVSVPAIYSMLLAHPLFAATDISTVRYIGYGGAPIAPTLVTRLATAFPGVLLSNGYGCTETSSLTSVLPHEYAAEHADSVGFAVPVVDVGLLLLDDTTGVGELLVRGPNVIAGYWNRPTADAEAFLGRWFRTGDIARIDDQGLIYLLDRVKDMINRGGENVYCVEVENALAQVPGVIESAVCGVPDSLLGEKVGAVVVAEPDLTTAQIVIFLRSRLADFKVPQYLVVRAEPLPRTPAGKVRKTDLRDSTDWGAPLRY